MLDQSEEKFVSEDMSIEVFDLYKTLNQAELNSYQSLIIRAIRFFIQQAREQQATNWKPDILSCNDSPAEIAINQYYAEHFDGIDNPLVVEVSDSLRHAFCSYAYGGLHQLFTRQENEVWYPKVILNRELKPNDISCLPDFVTIYRGTDQTEFDTKSYGQSWTTELQVAEAFAFQHYVSQPWFKACDRIVLKTTYPKSELYFSHQTCEYEVVVNPRKLQMVECIDSHNNKFKSDS